MSSIRIIYLVILGLCALGSGFFSGSETALIGIGKERVHQLAESGRRGRRVQQLVDNPERLLSTLLVANNLVNILAAAIATTLFIELLGERWGPWASTAVVTAVILVVGEITPKNLAVRYPESFSLAVAPTIWQLSRVMGPIARTFNWITRGLFWLVRLPAAPEESVTEADIRALADLGLAGGEIDEAEREIIDSLFTLADRPVREVMTPRVDIVAMSHPFTVDEVRELVATTGHSRYPVTSGDLDDLSGILYVKDLLALSHNTADSDMSELLRAPRFVPDSASILSVLQDLRTARSAFAVVLDEHGGVDGLVTIKDLVSELVGELQDEHDPGVPSVTRLGPRQWMADGRVPIEDLEEAVGIELPQGPYTTAGGLVMALSGDIPREGDSVAVEGLHMVVVRTDRHRIDKIRIDVSSA